MSKPIDFKILQDSSVLIVLSSTSFLFPKDKQTITDFFFKCKNVQTAPTVYLNINKSLAKNLN